MSIQAVGLKAYTNALNNFAKAEKTTKAGTLQPHKPAAGDFSEVLNSSLGKVNELQQEKHKMITSFASGETQNVHE